jgi:hypothetical protein
MLRVEFKPLRGLLLVLAGVAVLWILPNAYLDVYEKFRLATAVGGQSRAVFDGEAIAIESLRWRGGTLEVLFAHEVLSGYPQRLRPWATLRCRFWDASDTPLEQGVDVFHSFAPDFLDGRRKKQTGTFAIVVPNGAKFVAVQFAGTTWQTNKVKIPSRSLDTLAEWAEQFR